MRFGESPILPVSVLPLSIFSSSSRGWCLRFIRLLLQVNLSPWQVIRKFRNIFSVLEKQDSIFRDISSWLTIHWFWSESRKMGRSNRWRNDRRLSTPSSSRTYTRPFVRVPSSSILIFSVQFFCYLEIQTFRFPSDVFFGFSQHFQGFGNYMALAVIRISFPLLLICCVSTKINSFASLFLSDRLHEGYSLWRHFTLIAKEGMWIGHSQ